MSDTWKTKYIRRLVNRGLSKGLALATYEAGYPHDENFDAEDAADNEVSYWTDD